METKSFALYGTIHLLTLLFVSLSLPLLSTYFKKNHDRVRVIRYVLISLLVGFELLSPFYTYYFLHWSWQESLPLNMCDFSRTMLALYLIFEVTTFIQVGFFWGIGGALVAFFSPDIRSGFPSVEFFVFLFSHGIMLAIIAYVLSTRKYHPTFRCVLKAVFFGVSFTGLIYLLDIEIGAPANYWYLIKLPANATAFAAILPPAPWHVLGYVVIAATVFPIIYAPFALIRFIRRRQPCEELN